MHFLNSCRIPGMKHIFLITGLILAANCIPAQNNTNQPLFTWDLMWAGSWEESKTLHNRSDVRFIFSQPGLLVRGQALDRRPLNFKLDQPLGEAVNENGTGSFGLYHKTTGSRVLYGIIDEWGLPARIRSPWIRSAPYAENHKPVMADLKTTVSSTKTPEVYMYLSSPRFELFKNNTSPELSIRSFGSIQFPSQEDFAPSFSGGIDGFFGKKTELTLEGFYTAAQLPAKSNNSWFSDPPPLPARDFRLGAASMILSMPYFSFGTDWAWSDTFAYGSGIYGNAGIRFILPSSFNGNRITQKPSRWSISVAADGMEERYTGRDGTNPGGGFRTAGKVEWKGQRSSFFRAETSLRAPGLEEIFNRSSAGVYYRFPAPPSNTASAGNFPLRVTRVSLNTGRNASNPEKTNDSIDGALGLSLNLPPMMLPSVLLPSPAGKSIPKKPKPKNYPLNINLSANVKTLGYNEEILSPYPFFEKNQEFDSIKTACEFLWSPGILQFRSRWALTVFEHKDDLWETSFSTAIRLKHSRFSVKMASPDFPEKWNCTLSWRVEK